MADNPRNKPHIFLGATGNPESYTYPKQVQIKQKAVPQQIRATHSQNLLDNISSIQQEEIVLKQHADTYELQSRLGIQVAFESFPGVELAIERLADARKGIELLNVRHIEDQIFATVFVPEGKLVAFEQKIQSYVDRKTNKNGTPIDNQKLIDAIKSFQVAALEALWSDVDELFPDSYSELIWWEVWLPVHNDRSAVIHDFNLIATELDMNVSPFQLEFPERTVIHVQANKSQFASSTLLMSLVSELRLAKETAEFFDSLEVNEQREWGCELLSRLNNSGGDVVPYVCILDTGVNHEHPLLSQFTTQDDQLVVDPNWVTSDEDGHGTEMAGLALWGDLTEVLELDSPINIGHRLESVKLLRRSGDNKGKPHGVITADGVSYAEIENPERIRVFSMSLTSKDGRDLGRPSSWSSTLDSIAVDYINENLNPRLFTICAGNTGEQLNDLMEYPHYNETQDIHDPGQAWNVLTVGAFTNKTLITENTSYLPLAKAGSLSPYSTTSVMWGKAMPIKPDVVFEGGNIGYDEYSCAGLPDLKLLTTHNNISERTFSTTEATSAATALAARFSARIYAQYPEYWPETIRAITVHSANWTDEMLKLVSSENTNKQKAKRLIRLVGYGVPNIERAMWSARNSLSLIVQDVIQPYQMKKGRSDVSTKDMHIHELPWPKEALLNLGEVDVEMTVTLSYFIEPNPSSRNVSGKYSYPSHQLRFDVKRPSESTVEFKARLSRDAQKEEVGNSRSSGDANWLLGSYRNKGSIHKDIWKGTAAELAERGQLAIYPAMGWWKTRTQQKSWDKKARYSLVVSIEVPEVEVDIYTDVVAKIEAETVVVV